MIFVWNKVDSVAKYKNTFYFCPLLLQVAIVQFLIEHFSSIFGEDMTSPMLENAINQDNCSETSGTLNCLGDFDDKVTLIHPANDWVRLMHK